MQTAPGEKSAVAPPTLQARLAVGRDVARRIKTGIKIIRVTQRQPAEILQQVTIAKPETLQAPHHGRLVQTLLAQSNNGTSPGPFHVITLVTLTTMPETRLLSTLVTMTGLTLPTPG